MVLQQQYDRNPFSLMKRLQKIFLVLIALMTAIPSGQGQVFYASKQTGLFKVILDAGHGGRDPGAMGPNSAEKEITLAIALEAEKLVKSEHPDIEVIFTRTGDSFVPLHERASIANQLAADLFISIHCNSNPNPKLHGAETYVMGLHKSAENLEVAKTENAAIFAEEDYLDQYDGFEPDSDEDYIMLNMLQAATINQSIEFAKLVQEKLFASAGLINRGVKQAGFVVLYLTTMPGVLIETGYLSNAEDEQFLLQKINQQKIALAIVEAMARYKETLEKETQVASAPQPVIMPVETPSATAHVYRIWFASFKKPKSKSDRIFTDLPQVWNFNDDDGYHYTFEKAATLEEINAKLMDYRQSRQLNKRYLKNIKIIETEDDKIISVQEPN